MAIFNKHRFILVFTLLLCCNGFMSAQQWGKYTLYSENGSSIARLIDTTNAVFHTWTMTNAPTGYSSYLLPGQILCRSVDTNNPYFQGGGIHGRIQKVDWNSNVIWDYTHSTNAYVLHHDHHVLPNGNVLMISYEVKTPTEAYDAGCMQSMEIHPEKIIEVQPTGATTGTIVWEWHVWDHLVQSQFPTRANYQTSISAHPELLNINYQTDEDWLHMNGIDYNEALDQIAISTHNLNEVYIIDHSTTTAEAASHIGGNSGKGGDFLYRWGNPAAYQSGNGNANVFDVLHDVHWIPQDCPNPGRLVAYNNDWSTMTQSSIIQWEPPVNGYLFDLNPGPAYGPATFSHRQTCNGFNSNMGNSQQLPNGNTLICMAMLGTIYEIGPTGTLLWTRQLSGSCSQAFRYSDCYVNGGTPPTATLIASADSVCPLDSVQIDLTPDGNNYTYVWSSNPAGFTSTLQSPTVAPSVTTVYHVTVTNAGCSSTQAITVVVDGPPRPTITLVQDTLFASSAVAYQWYLNGVLIVGATNDYYVPTQSGSYTVVTTASNGCESVPSLPRVVTLVGIDIGLGNGWLVYPNPNNGTLRLLHPDLGLEEWTIAVADAHGRRVVIVSNVESIDLSFLENGLYFVSIFKGASLISTQKVSLIR